MRNGWLFFGLLVLASGCNTAPVVRSTDTTIQQEQVRRAIEKLDQYQPTDTQKTDTLAIYTAREALRSCGQALHQKTEEMRQCETSLADLSKKHDSQTLKYREIKEKNSFFSRLGRYWDTLMTGIFIGAAGIFLLQRFGKTILSFLLTALKSKIPW